LEGHALKGKEMQLGRRIQELAEKKYGVEDLPAPIENFVETLTYYSEMKQITRSEGLVERIGSILDEDDYVKGISELHQEIEGLRIVPEIVDSETEDFVSKIAERFWLSPQESKRLEDLTEIYAGINKEHEWDNLGFLPRDESAILRCVSVDLAGEYLGILHDRGIWPDLGAIMFPESQLVEMEKPPSSLRELVGTFLDESHYRDIEEKAKSRGNIVLEGLGRAMCVFVRLMKDKDYLGENHLFVQETIEKLDSIEAEMERIRPEARDLIFTAKAFIHLAVGGRLDRKQQLKHLEIAESILNRIHNPFLKPLYFNVLWLRAGLHDEPEKGELQLRAFEQLGRHIAGCSLIEEAVPRLLLMSQAMLMLPVWRYQQGDFRGSLEAAMAARQTAIAAGDVFASEMESTIEEMDEELRDPNLDEEERQFISSLKENMIMGIQAVRSVTYIGDLLIYMSRGRISEQKGDFREASRLFMEASDLGKEIFRGLREMIKSLFGDLLDRRHLPEKDFSLDAWSYYFDGVSNTNKGNESLMKGEVQKAERLFLKAHNSYELSLQSMEQAKAGSPEASQSPLTQTIDFASLASTQLDMCNIHLTVISAEEYAAIDNHEKSSKEFLEANLRAAEMLNNPVRMSDKNVEIVKGMRDYCFARSMLERTGGEFGDDSSVWIELLFEASASFGRADQRLWECFVEGLAYEYEALYNVALSRKDKRNKAHYFTSAISSVNKAMRSYSLTGNERRIKELSSVLGRIDRIGELPHPTVVLPRPVEVFSTMADEDLSSSFMMPYTYSKGSEVIELDKELMSLRSRALALSNTIDELKVRLERGRIEVGRYSDLKTDMDAERITILTKLGKYVKDIDKDMYEITQLAIDEDEDTVRKELTKVAVKKKMGKSFIKKIKEHKGTILSLIVDGALKAATLI
jgi:tetratricopeptide (TPR) repeat protein